MDRKDCIVVGLITGTSKKGQPYTMVQYLREFDGDTNAQHRVGQECCSQYVPGTFNLDIGDTVEFEFELTGNGFPRVIGVHSV